MNRANPIVRVGFFWKASKGRYFLKWKDPEPFSKKYLTRQTDVTTRNSRAERAVGKLAEAVQAEINERLRRPDADLTWDDFCTIYERDHLAHTSQANQYKWRAVVAIFAKAVGREILGPVRMSDISPRLMVAIETQVRLDVSPGSVSSYMATLRAGLNWGASLELVRVLPRNRMRGRQQVELPAMRLEPITEESLRKMQGVCHQFVGKAAAESVKDYLRALWLSGCRMREPLEIHAERRDCHRPLELDGPNPRMCWTASQKNRRDQISPITPEFAAELQSRIHAGGFLYVPSCETGPIKQRTALSKLVSAIGTKAGVIAEPGAEQPHATAKHFRSSFVTRLSLQGLSLERIQKMVRHRDVATTRKYYLGTADELGDTAEIRSQLRVVG